MSKKQTIIEQLRQERKAANISQAKLAELAGMTQQQISMYENGVKSPSIDTVQRIAEVLGLQLTLAPGTKPIS